jgi:putative ABC transport system ATP-binding protein
MSEPVYEVRALRRTFGGVTALDEVSFSVGEGEHVAVCGPSGAGKTTLLNVLGLLDAEFEGEVTLSGRAVRGLPARERARLRLAEIGFVFQAFHLLPGLTVRDNVALPHWRLHGSRRRARRRAEEILDGVGLGPRLSFRPAQLSAGEAQRAAVARAVINEPRVVLADEPTGNLDRAATETLLELFSAIHGGGNTLVVISHDPEVVAAASRRIELRYGRLVSESGEKE